MITVKEINDKINLIIYMSVIFCYNNNGSFADEINKISIFDLSRSRDTKYLIPYVNENRKKIQRLIVKYYKEDKNINTFIEYQYKQYSDIYQKLRESEWEISETTGHAFKPEKIILKEIPNGFSDINQRYNAAFELLK